MIKYFFFLFMTLPAVADFGYDPQSNKFCTTEMSSKIDRDEYHALAVATMDIIIMCAENYENHALCFMKIMTFLKNKGTFTALQLTKDLAKIWGYNG